jgi:pyruvate/2-oxoglutarate dehydrogenase complex dihydrolipoamide acyltransferase (E2) component
MLTTVRAPRVNNNDDAVKLSHVFAEIGAAVRIGDPLVDVETDKATFTVESEVEGYLLAIGAVLGDMVPVGGVLAWIGSAPNEPLADAPPSNGATGQSPRPTLKARLLLQQQKQSQSAALAPGTTVALTPEQRGMCRTVSWQRDEAVAAHLEIAYDPHPWASYAAEFQRTNGLMFDPLLALLSWQLAKIAAATPRINATISGHEAWHYDQVNLGFTVQSDSTLYLVVVRNAAGLGELEFVRELSALQLAAARHSLNPEQTSAATIAFSSMARWKVTGHVPVLPPHTALIVAHTAPQTTGAHLGATYDHRLLTGFDVARVLEALADPKWHGPPGPGAGRRAHSPGGPRH